MITPGQIRERKISTVEGGGYDRNEVNELLVDILESYEAVCAENKELYRKMEILANRIEEYREDEDSIKTALISAQKMANHLTQEAKDKAEKLLSESSASAQQTVQDAREKADRIVGEAREYVSNLTKEKAKAADEIVSDAQSKANAAISSAKVVARDTVEKARNITGEISEKAKQEISYHREIVAKLKEESKEFKSTLMSLYEAQLNKLKELVETEDDSQSISSLEEELKVVMGDIDTIAENDFSQDTAEEPSIDEIVDESAESDSYENEGEAESDEADAVQEESEAEDEIDEIIEEIEAEEHELTLEEDEAEPPTVQEVKNALDAFTEDEITPVEAANSTSIPIINDDAEMEPPMPFEDFFNVDTSAAGTDETISLKAPDEDNEEDDHPKFKGFFKKKK